MTIFPRFTFVPIFRRDTFPLFIRSSPHPSTLPSLFLSPLSLSLSYQCNNTKATLRLSLDPLPSSTSIELHFLFITFHPFHSSSTLHPTTISHPSSPSFHFLPRQQQIPSPFSHFIHSTRPHAPQHLVRASSFQILFSLPPQLLPFIAPFPPILPPSPPPRGFILRFPLAPPPPTSLLPNRPSRGTPVAPPPPFQRTRAPARNSSVSSQAPTRFSRVQSRHSAVVVHVSAPCAHFRVPCFRPPKGKEKRGGGKREREEGSGKEVDPRVRWSRSERPAKIDAR